MNKLQFGLVLVFFALSFISPLALYICIYDLTALNVSSASCSLSEALHQAVELFWGDLRSFSILSINKVHVVRLGMFEGKV